jgi:hypothetical protein
LLQYVTVYPDVGSECKDGSPPVGSQECLAELKG